MDETDGFLFALGLGGLAVALLLIASVVRSLQEDMALLRITAAVPEIERHS
jgi:hypothetical protein